MAAKKVTFIHPNNLQGKLAIEHVAMRHADRAINTLLDVMEDTEETGSARVGAANSLLDRAFGSVMQRSAVLMAGDPIHSDLSRLTTRELITQALALSRPAIESALGSDQPASPTTPGIDLEMSDE